MCAYRSVFLCLYCLMVSVRCCFSYLFVCLLPCVSPCVCLCVCLSACMSACISECLSVWLPTSADQYIIIGKVSSIHVGLESSSTPLFPRACGSAMHRFCFCLCVCMLLMLQLMRYFFSCCFCFCSCFCYSFFCCFCFHCSFFFCFYCFFCFCCLCCCCYLLSRLSLWIETTSIARNILLRNYDTDERSSQFVQFMTKLHIIRATTLNSVYIYPCLILSMSVCVSVCVCECGCMCCVCEYVCVSVSVCTCSYTNMVGIHSLTFTIVIGRYL